MAMGVEKWWVFEGISYYDVALNSHHIKPEFNTCHLTFILFGFGASA